MVVVSPRQVVAALDATARRRQEEAVAGAYATAQPHRAARMKAAEESRRVPLMVGHAVAAPRMQEVETAAAAVEVASDATEPPREVAAMVGSGALELPPAGAVRDAAAERRPVGVAAARRAEAAVGAAPHAGAEAAAARDVVALRRVAAEAAVRDVAAQRQAEALEAPAVPQAAAVPSAAALVFHQGRLRPAAAAAPQPAARSAHERRCLRTASRSARSLQAAQDEVWSWRSRFLESLL